MQHAGQDRLESVEHGHFAGHGTDARVTKRTGESEQGAPLYQTVGIDGDENLSRGTRKSGRQSLAFSPIDRQMDGLHEVGTVGMTDAIVERVGRIAAVVGGAR